MKNWVAKGIASEVNDFTHEGDLLSVSEKIKELLMSYYVHSTFKKTFKTCLLGY